MKKLERLNIPFCLVILTALFTACDKNVVDIPQKEPEKIVISNLISGLNIVDFIFEQKKTATTDTVWLSIRNNTASDITDLTYLVELCKALPLSYDNCNSQLTAKISQTLKANSTLSRIQQWNNKGIQLNPDYINVGVISFNNDIPHPLAGAYNSSLGYADFLNDISNSAFYGEVRGYILTDGISTFRLKANDVNYNLNGRFINTSSFDGLLKKDSTVVTPFSLDKIENTDPTNLKFRIALQAPLDNIIKYIAISTQKSP